MVILRHGDVCLEAVQAKETEAFRSIRGSLDCFGGDVLLVNVIVRLVLLDSAMSLPVLREVHIFDKRRFSSWGLGAIGGEVFSIE